jgi:hypothetical protein
MYFRLKGGRSVLLMSQRRDAQYEDHVEAEGRVLIYEGHDAPRMKGGPDPKNVDQPDFTPKGTPTQNELFFKAAFKFTRDGCDPELVDVYEKMHRGIWVFNGTFRLVDAWNEQRGSRKVFKFKLELMDQSGLSSRGNQAEIEHERLIPSSVKLDVWKRDRGRCVKCGAQVNLHFDHIIPYSKGGSSLVAQNIQLLCARHNLEKRDKIE